MNRKMKAFLSAILLLSVTTIAHAEMDTVPAKIIPLLTIPEATSDLGTSPTTASSPISKSQIDHFSLIHKHPQSIPHDKATSASQDDVTIGCLLWNGGTVTVEGPLNLSSTVKSALYQKKCEVAYPSCWPDSNCKWRLM